MAFLNSLDIIGSALTSERYRTDVILQNIANARTTRTSEGGPYRRKQVVFEERPLTFRETFRHACKVYRTEQGGPTVHENNRFIHAGGHNHTRSGELQQPFKGGVQVQTMVDSINEFKPVYDPEHPDADADGYVWYPNVDTTEEIVDLMAATNAYEANLAALGVVKAMINKSINMGK